MCGQVSCTKPCGSHSAGNLISIEFSDAKITKKKHPPGRGMPLELVRLNLLNLNGNYAVLSSAFEELNVCTVGGGLNVLFLGTSVEEEVNNGLYTLL